MEYGIRAIIVAGFLMFFKDLLVKLFWSVLIYFTRGEFNEDGNDSTPDRFLLLNPNLGDFTECWILHYSLFCVSWGFFREGKFIYKKSSWLSWAGFKDSRFPMGMKTDGDDIGTVIDLLKKR